MRNESLIKDLSRQLLFKNTYYEMNLTGICTSISVSYTHLDVYKRQGRSIHESISEDG